MSNKVRRFIQFSSNFVEKDSRGVSTKSWKEIPGPSSLPIIQQTHHYLPGGFLYNLSGSELWNKLYETYGPITTVKIFSKKPLVFLFDADAIKKVVTGESYAPIRTGLDTLDYYRRYYKKSEPPEAVGLTTEQGDTWRKYRMIANQIMLKPKTIQMYRKPLEEVADDMIKRFKIQRDDQNRMPADFDEDLKLFALESIAVVALGQRLNCLDLNLPDDAPGKTLTNCVRKMFIYLDQLDIKPSLWHYFSTKTFKKSMKNFEELDRCIKNFIKQSVVKMEQGGSVESADGQKGVLEQLLNIDEYFASVMAGDMLIGGVDTTSNAVNAILYHLAKNPEKQETLRDSLYSSTDNKYLRACIKEALRVTPVVGMHRRESTKPYNLLGYDVPVGVGIVFCIEHLMNSEKNFPQAKSYIPERWTVEPDHPLYAKNAHPYSYAPFGFGVRSCIGRRIVELEMDIIIEKIIKNFQVEWHGPKPKILTSTVNFMQGPFRFVFKDI